MRIWHQRLHLWRLRRLTRMLNKGACPTILLTCGSCIIGTIPKRASIVSISSLTWYSITRVSMTCWPVRPTDGESSFITKMVRWMSVMMPRQRLSPSTGILLRRSLTATLMPSTWWASWELDAAHTTEQRFATNWWKVCHNCLRMNWW